MYTDIIDKPTRWTEKSTILQKQKVSSLSCRYLSSSQPRGHLSNIGESRMIINHLDHWSMIELPVTKVSSEIKISNSITVSLPNELNYLANTILTSKYILDLEDNWDDDGAEKYEDTTLKIAIEFLINFGNWINHNRHSQMYIPQILHSSDKSIDIFWEEEDFRLIINIAEIGDKASFYWDNAKDLSQYIEGNFNIENVNFMLIPTPQKL